MKIKLSDEDILLCPFCGHHTICQKDKGTRYYQCRCVGCEVSGKPSILKSTAIQEWNTRIYREDPPEERKVSLERKDICTCTRKYMKCNYHDVKLTEIK